MIVIICNVIMCVNVLMCINSNDYCNNDNDNM